MKIRLLDCGGLVGILSKLFYRLLRQNCSFGSMFEVKMDLKFVASYGSIASYTNS